MGHRRQRLPVALLEDAIAVGGAVLILWMLL